MNHALHQPKEPWLAVNLSLLLAGVGQVYAGKPWKGVIFLAAELTLLAACLTALLHPDGSVLLACGLGVALAVFHVYNLSDAFRAPRRQTVEEQEPKPKKARWLAVFLTQLLPGLGHLYSGKWLWGVCILVLNLLSHQRRMSAQTSQVLHAILAASAAVLIAGLCYHVFVSTPGAASLPRKRIVYVSLAIAGVAILKIALACGVREFVAEPFVIPTRCMEPTVLKGDYVLVTRSLGGDVAKPGDVIAYVPPGSPRKVYIHRLVAVGGEKLEMHEGKLVVDGTSLSDGPFRRLSYLRGAEMGFRNVPSEFEIPQDSVFVLGDNSPNSKDSRFLGAVPSESIIGKVYKTCWPLGRAGAVR